MDAQCGGGAHLPDGSGLAGEGEQGSRAPSNALLALHGPRKASAVADIEGVGLEGSTVSEGHA